jgi:hypothetical protein
MRVAGLGIHSGANMRWILRQIKEIRFYGRLSIPIMIVRVYNFIVEDRFSGRKLTSSFKYPAERIERLGCEILFHSAIDVDESQLDDDGAYVPGAGALKQRRPASRWRL